jgi:sodium-dependent dicarboxylate transporter 2/3/5
MIGLGIVALLGVVLYLIFGLIKWEDLNRNTNWGVIILFGAAISLGVQMTETGAAMWVAEQAISGLKFITPNIEILRWFVAVFLTGIMTNLLSNAATVAVIGPIVLNMGGDQILLGFSTAIASAFAYLTVVASPTCMIIHSSGLLTSRDYLKAGWKMFLMSVAVLFLMYQLW